MRKIMDKKAPALLAGVLCLAAMPMDAAFATSDFSSVVTVTYTINSITNNDNPGDLSGLGITAGYFLDIASSYVDIPQTSDGTATPLSSADDDFVDPVVGSYSYTMDAGGSVNDGRVDAFYLGLFDLSFVNYSSDSFDINVTLNYDFTAGVAGNYAENSIQLDYYNDAGDFDSGFGYSVLASTPFDLADSLNGSVDYGFKLGAFASDGLYVDAGVSGYLEAASPVPVPAAVWLMSTGLIALGGMQRRNQPSAA